MNHVQFNASPALGETIHLDSQIYRLVASEPYRRKDGQVSAVLTWASECATCGESFAQQTGLVTKSLNRRCGACKKPRHPVACSHAKVSVSVGRRLMHPVDERGE